MPATIPGVTTNYGGIPGAAQPGSQSANLIGTGGTGGFLGSLFGQIPGVANPIVSASEATGGNRENLGNIANLTSGVDTISAAGAALPFINNLPGYESNLNQASTNTASELAGQLPQDVINEIQQQAAERGVATGQGPDSPNTNASYLQNIGLNSLNLQNQGLSNFEGLIGSTPTGASFNPASMLVSPQDEQAANQAVNTAEAAPDPSVGGLTSLITSSL